MLQCAASRGACLANHLALELLVEHAIDGAADRGRWVMTHGNNVQVQRAVIVGVARTPSAHRLGAKPLVG